MSLGTALDFVKFDFGDVSWVLEGSETIWGRDRAEGGDGGCSAREIASCYKMEAIHVLGACGNPLDSKSLL